MLLFYPNKVLLRLMITSQALENPSHSVIKHTFLQPTQIHQPVQKGFATAKLSVSTGERLAFIAQLSNNLDKRNEFTKGFIYVYWYRQ